MPSIVGPVKINTVSGITNFGDSLNLAPKTTSKTYTGSGSFSTGDIQVHNDIISITNSVDPDVTDNTMAANN